MALAGVIVCIFGADTGKPESSSCETKALRVEIRHYESESAVDGSDDIVERDMDVFECDVGGALCKRHSELQEEDQGELEWQTAYHLHALPCCTSVG